MSGKTARFFALAAIGAGLIAGVTYWSLRSACDDRDPGLRGEVKRQAGGKLLYFDGRCWTPEPQPPTDTPF